MSKEVILTGLRSNAEFHLGNYLGAILPMVSMQRQHAGDYQINMFVPDLHSFTTPIDHSKLYDQTLQNLKVYLAAGLEADNTDTFIYRQSMIPAHSELTWIFDCFTSFGELSRMTQFKEKSSDEQFVSAGLFNYPVLMAADILLYGARWVPVGDDQQQHLEFARNLAIRFNNKFGELFVVPEPVTKQNTFINLDAGVRIRSLRKPDKKMSKSVNDPAGTIMLSDSPDEAAKKIMSATTDSINNIKLDFKEQPGVSNLLQILALAKGHDLKSEAKKWEGQSSYGPLKQAAADAVAELLTALQENLKAVDEPLLLKRLEEDETKVAEVANKVLHSVQQAVGLRKKN